VARGGSGAKVPPLAARTETQIPEKQRSHRYTDGRDTHVHTTRAREGLSSSTADAPHTLLSSESVCVCVCVRVCVRVCE